MAPKTAVILFRLDSYHLKMADKGGSTNSIAFCPFLPKPYLDCLMLSPIIPALYHSQSRNGLPNDSPHHPCF
jgi:hypothetical protein